MSTAPPFGTTVPGNRWDLIDAELAAPARTVTAVVTHFEQPAQLERTLAALRRQTRPVDEIVVADDGSQEPPASGRDVTVVGQPDQGFRAAAARNLGVRRSTSDLLVFLDADTTPEPTYVERLTRLPARLPELLAVGRRRHARLDRAPLGAPVEEFGPEHELAEPGWLRRGYSGTGDLREADTGSHRFVLSSVLACSRWWFDQIGGFDETFVGYGGEDWELAARSWLRGGLVAHVPQAVAWHDGPAVGEPGRRHLADDTGLAETLAIAQRVGAPGATYRGLLLGPPDTVVTADPGLGQRDLTVTLDSLLAALPRCAVALPVSGAQPFADDPRVCHAPPDAADPARWLDSGYRVHLHLAAPVVGPAAAWQDVVARLESVDPPATSTVLADGDQPVAVLHDLRQHRRARRWAGRAGVLDLLAHAPTRVSLQRADTITLQGWLEGWAGR